tara:strand:+ start:1064 stop:1582 length:519 start_codon:yes stop_codon:yes gene_type:complete
MAKLGFKDFLNVDYAPGEDDQIKKNAKRRKVSDVEEAQQAELEMLHRSSRRRMKEDVEPLDEVLSTQQRLAKGRKMRILAPRIALGRKRAMKRAADPKRLKNRAKKQARNTIFKKLSKGVSRSDMSPARRAEIEKRINKMGNRIDRLAIKLLPTARKMDRDRRAAANKGAKK